MSSHVKTEDQTVSKIAFVDIDAEAFEDPFRIDEDRARDLAASILANGLDNPITVARSGRGRNVAYGVTAGWHRHLAIQYIREGFEHGGVAYDAQPEFMNEVLVTVMDDVTEVNMLIRSVVENAHRRTPSQSEIAGVVARLLKAGMSKEDIAERLGRGVTAVSRAAKFHRDAAPALRALSVDGRIDNATAHHACALSEAAQVRVADAVHGGRDAREAVNDERSAVGQAPVRPPRATKTQLRSFIEGCLNEDPDDQFTLGALAALAFAHGMLDATDRSLADLTEYLDGVIGGVL